MEKRKIQITIGVVVLLFIVALFSVKRIDAGHAGIKVSNYGDDKGVSNVAQVTGWVFYNPVGSTVHEVPTFVQTANYKISKDAENNTELRLNTKDGMVVTMDASMNYYTPDSSVVQIFKKYRKPVPELENNVLRNMVIGVMNEVCGNYNSDEVYEKKNELEVKAKAKLKKNLGKEGFIVDDFLIVGELRLPPAVVHNINEKVNAIQIALKKQSEVQQFFFDSQKNVVQAKGDSTVAVVTASGRANSVLIEATAQAQANIKISSTLTEQLIKYVQANNWDGKVSTYSGMNGNQVILPIK